MHVVTTAMHLFVVNADTIRKTRGKSFVSNVNQKTTKTMTEQELRQEFKNHSDCYSDAFEVIQAMTEDAAIALAKAYSDARESKSASKVAEIRRLCKAFLYDLPCSHNVSVIGEFLDAYADNKILDEFKKTVVAAKDTEIAYWKDRWEAGNKAHDAEFSSIIAQNAENKRLNAEVERLREGIQDAVDWLNNPDDNVDFDELLQSLLSPAPVTEGKSHGEAITSKPKPREPITALEAMSRLKSENEVRKLESETRILHELFHQVGNSTWVAKGCAEITLEANGTWTLERIGKKGKKAIIINKPLWQCLQKAKAIIEKLGSHKNEDQE